MIHPFILFFLIVFMGLYAEEKPKHTKICLNMIVKDESKVIKRCLESVKPIIDYWVIVDTGSSDGTQKIIKYFMRDIPGELYERPWVNFGHNRDEALQLAKNKGDYLLFIDADEYLTFADNFEMPHLDKDLYLIIVRESSDGRINDLKRNFLINNHLDWHWKGVLHEQLECNQAIKNDLLSNVINYTMFDGRRNEDPKKNYKDAMLLEKVLKDDPNNSRYIFYLARAYECAGMYPETLKNYERRSVMGGDQEEVFWSLYALGRLQEILNFPKDVIIKSYCKAFEFDPFRAEPLYQLGHFYNLNKEYLLGCITLNVAKEISSTQPGLFTQKWIYDYAIKFELGISYYCLGGFTHAAQIFQELLDNKEVPIDVKKNIEKNLEKVKSKISTVK